MSAVLQVSASPEGGIGAVWVARAEGADGGFVLKGWALSSAEAPQEPPELAFDIAGEGVRVGQADLPWSRARKAAEGAREFLWSRPSDLVDAGPLRIRVWHLDTGEELEGSPVELPASGNAPRAVEGGAPLLHWHAGLAGEVGIATPVKLADGLHVTAGLPIRSLRFEMLDQPAHDPAAPPNRGVRLVAGQPGAHVTAHLQLRHPPAPDRPRLIQLLAWLPEATEAAVQVQGEIWLTRREADGSFQPVRRLRRSRIFRRPGIVSAELTVTKEEAGAAGELWISLVARDARGLCVMPPEAVETSVPAEARMEDARLETSFRALEEMVRLHGAASGASPLLPFAPPERPHAAAAGPGHPPTEVVLPVYNGDLVVRDCLRTLRACADPNQRVLVVDDGSRAFTAALLAEEVAGDERFRLHRRDINRGYTKSINEGVLMTTAPWVVILNSDTLLPAGWLDRLHAAVRARPGTGMAGPLSNAATWQSIPAAKRQDGSWSTNDMIEPRHLDQVQALLDRESERAYPEFPVLNGFCTLIAREVFDRVGFYDEDAFPMGYGEETDLCLRARRAGFRLTVADDGFVYHHKSVSFGSANRSRLTRAGGLEMTNKHLGVNIPALEQKMQACPSMLRLRARMLDALAELD